MATARETQIDESARGPKRVRGDSIEVEQMPIDDQIKADRYLASKDASREGLGIRRTRTSPPGAV